MRVLLNQVFGIKDAQLEEQMRQKSAMMPMTTGVTETRENPAASISEPPLQSTTLRLDDIRSGLPNDAPVIVLVAAPGVNKSEFARRIMEKYDGFVHLSMGQLLRATLKEKSSEPYWQGLQSKMTNGELLPIAPCRKLMHDAISGVGGKPWGYVIEGYPRTVEQAKDFENRVPRLDMVLLIDCTEKFVQQRLKERMEKVWQFLNAFAIAHSG